MAQEDDAYYISRAKREYAAAQAASCPSARLAHLSLAELYIERIKYSSDITVMKRTAIGMPPSVSDISVKLALKKLDHAH